MLKHSLLPLLPMSQLQRLTDNLPTPGWQLIYAGAQAHRALLHNPVFRVLAVFDHCCYLQAEAQGQGQAHAHAHAQGQALGESSRAQSARSSRQLVCIGGADFETGPVNCRMDVHGFTQQGSPSSTSLASSSVPPYSPVTAQTAQTYSQKPRSGFAGLQVGQRIFNNLEQRCLCLNGNWQSEPDSAEHGRAGGGRWYKAGGCNSDPGLIIDYHQLSATHSCLPVASPALLATLSQGNGLRPFNDQPFDGERVLFNLSVALDNDDAGLLWPLLRCHITANPLQMNSGQDDFARRMVPAVSDLLKTLRESYQALLRCRLLASDGLPGREELQPLLSALQRLIGLGSGLTPAGDDFLAGMFSAFHISDRAGLATLIWQQLDVEIQQRTHVISACHLENAANGRVTTSAEKLIKRLILMLENNLLAQSREQDILPAEWEFSVAVNKLSNKDEAAGIALVADTCQAIGSSSGWDFLAGFIFTLQAEYSNEPMET